MNLLYAKLVAWLVKWGALLALLIAVCGALFIGGCRHGTTQQHAKDKAAITAADARANGYAAQVAILSTTIHLIDADTANATRLAAEQAKRASVAEQHAAAAAKGYAKAVEQIERDLVQAQSDPDCQRILESRTCARLR